MSCAVWSVHASNAPAEVRIPPPLREVSPALEREVFSDFQSFRLLAYRDLTVRYQQPQSLVLPAAYELKLALLERPSYSVYVDLRLRRGPESSLVDLRTRLKGRRTLALVGGPYTQGEFLILLRCVGMLPR